MLHISYYLQGCESCVSSSSSLLYSIHLILENWKIICWPELCFFSIFWNFWWQIITDGTHIHVIPWTVPRKIIQQKDEYSGCTSHFSIHDMAKKINGCVTQEINKCSSLLTNWEFVCILRFPLSSRLINVQRRRAELQIVSSGNLVELNGNQRTMYEYISRWPTPLLLALFAYYLLQKDNYRIFYKSTYAKTTKILPIRTELQLIQSAQ